MDPPCLNAFAGSIFHIYLPPARPNSVLKVGLHAPSFAGALIVQEDMARGFLSGWSDAGDCDQGCSAAGPLGR